MVSPKTQAKTQAKTETKTDLYVCIDCGGSATKILYQVSQGSALSFLSMSPLVEKIEPSWLENYFKLEGSLISPAPEQEAYIEWNQQTYVIGHFANRFYPEDRIGEPKYENATYKVLAALGVIAQQLRLSANKVIKIQLAILLPWNEYQDSKILEERLQEMLSSYLFRSQRMRVKIQKFVCRPEGFGLAMLRMRQMRTDYFKSSNIAVLMLGHRNSTALMFEKGALRGDSPLYGFKELLDLVVERTAGLERDILAQAIFEAIGEALKDADRGSHFNSKRPDFAKTKAFQVLGRAKDSGLRNKEIAKVAEVLKTVTQEYWLKLNRWFDKFLLPNADLSEVIISGGAAIYWKPELEERFNCELRENRSYSYGSDKNRWEYWTKNSSLPSATIVLDAGIQASIEKQNWFRSKLSHRVTDCYGLLDYLLKGDGK